MEAISHHASLELKKTYLQKIISGDGLANLKRLGLEDVRAFQVHLVANGISWPALNQTVCALRFFYGVTLGHAEIPERIAYARLPRTLPVVLSADEVVQFLVVPSLKTRTAFTTAYALRPLRPLA